MLASGAEVNSGRGVALVAIMATSSAPEDRGMRWGLDQHRAASENRAAWNRIWRLLSKR